MKILQQERILPLRSFLIAIISISNTLVLTFADCFMVKRYCSKQCVEQCAQTRSGAGMEMCKVYARYSLECHCSKWDKSERDEPSLHLLQVEASWFTGFTPHTLRSTVSHKAGTMRSWKFRHDDSTIMLKYERIRSVCCQHEVWRNAGSNTKWSFAFSARGEKGEFNLQRTKNPVSVETQWSGECKSEMHTWSWREGDLDGYSPLNFVWFMSCGFQSQLFALDLQTIRFSFWFTHDIRKYHNIVMAFLRRTSLKLSQLDTPSSSFWTYVSWTCTRSEHHLKELERTHRVQGEAMPLCRFSFTDQDITKWETRRRSNTNIAVVIKFVQKSS